MSEELELGSRVRSLREARNLTQTEFGEFIDLDASAISKIESGKRGLAAGELALICQALGIRSDEVLFGMADTPTVGLLFRANAGANATRAVEAVEAAFANYRYVKALIES